MEPLTELRPVNGPVVYGYLRLVRASPSRHAALAASLTEYCRQHELRLSGLFTERCGPGSGTPAFDGLLDALELPDTYGVVIPTTSHLGPRAAAAERERRIERTGTRLLLVRRNHRTPVAGRQK
ncbi:hypothetical protein ACFRFL_14920 [Streptomyces sp. NPDC056708]|uniref:hypothetical protein n=1 Tax=unclassified Streptomyces TaxID=2593676 RepID=UPI0036B22C4A